MYLHQTCDTFCNKNVCLASDLFSITHYFSCKSNFKGYAAGVLPTDEAHFSFNGGAIIQISLLWASKIHIKSSNGTFMKKLVW